MYTDYHDDFQHHDNDINFLISSHEHCIFILVCLGMYSLSFHSGEYYSPTALQTLYMALVIDITDGCGLSNKIRHELLSKNNAVFAIHFIVNAVLPAVLHGAF